MKKGNLLSRPTEGKDMKIVDIMKEDDFTNANTVKGVIRHIEGTGDIFFYFNRVLAVRRGSD